MPGNPGTRGARPARPLLIPGAPVLPGTKPKVVLSFSPRIPKFAISGAAEMPLIAANALLVNVTPKPGELIEFVWTATLKFNGLECANAQGRHTSHPPMHGRTIAAVWVIPFSHVRGGTLSVAVRARVQNQIVETESKVTIEGTNPTTQALLQMQYPHEVFKQVMRQESNLHQFTGDQPGGTGKCPLFSGGDVGICQLSRKPRHPTDEQIWNWKANVKEGISRWNEHREEASQYSATIESSARFKHLVELYNHDRVKKKLKPLKKIALPAFNDEQLLFDTIRGYNGWAGGVHEYEPETDAHGHLLVTIDPDGTKGTAGWHRLTAAEREHRYRERKVDETQWGDLDYVELVRARKGF